MHISDPKPMFWRLLGLIMAVLRTVYGPYLATERVLVQISCVAYNSRNSQNKFKHKLNWNVYVVE